jgi:hypothetical protein
MRQIWGISADPTLAAPAAPQMWATTKHFVPTLANGGQMWATMGRGAPKPYAVGLENGTTTIFYRLLNINLQ